MNNRRKLVIALGASALLAPLVDAGAETVNESPQKSSATMKSNMAKWGKLIQDAGQG